MTQPGPWWAEYIGIPFVDHGRARAGLDCWGLVRLAYAEQRGILLPSWGDYPSVSDAALTERIINAALPDFQEVDPMEWALVLFHSHVSGYHVGLLTDPLHMLHVRLKASTVRERWAGFRSMRRVGFYLPAVRTGT